MTDPINAGDARAVTVCAAAFTGSTAHVLRIRAQHTAGVRLVGLPAEHAWLTRDRLYAAIVFSGLTWPAGPLTLTVFPHELPAGDSGLDLAYALTLLAAAGQVPAHRVTELACLGELGLDGSLRPVPGLTQRAQGARRRRDPHHRAIRRGPARRSGRPRPGRVRRDESGRSGGRGHVWRPRPSRGDRLDAIAAAGQVQ